MVTSTSQFPFRAALIAGLVIALAGCAGNELGSDVAKATTTTTAKPSAGSTTTTSVASGPTTTLAEPGPPSAASGFPADWQPKPLVYTSCTATPGAECADLEVPLDWSNPVGAQITLKVIKFASTGTPEERVGSMVSNPGGPGGSGIGYLSSEPNPFPNSLRKSFDLVSWDPRGVGESAGFTCGSGGQAAWDLDLDPDTPDELNGLNTASSDGFADCATNAKDAPLLAHVGTDDQARDLEAIRRAIGDKRLTYLGFSYGTYLGERYLALFPERVRAMVLDGAVDPRQKLTDLLTSQAKAQDDALGRILEACTKNKACPLDDPFTQYDDVKNDVEAAGLDSSAGSRSVGPGELGVATAYATYDPESWPVLWQALAAALDGDGQLLQDMADGYHDGSGGWTAYMAISCVDSTHPTTQAEWATFVDGLRQLSPRLGGNTGNEMLPCATWPTAPKDSTGTVTGEGGPDILVLGNTGDAATPYEASQQVAEMLTKGHLVTFQGEGHTSYSRSECVRQVTNNYLVTLEVPPQDPNCDDAGGNGGV